MNILIYFLIFSLLSLIFKSVFTNIREGLTNNDNTGPTGPPAPYPTDKNPSSRPPGYKTVSSEPPKDVTTIANENPADCSCMDRQTLKIYDQNTNLLNQIKKDITSLSNSVKDSSNQIMDMSTNLISATITDDSKICCGVDKGGAKCKSQNNYDCSALESSEADQDAGNVTQPSTPTAAQIQAGEV